MQVSHMDNRAREVQLEWSLGREHLLEGSWHMLGKGRLIVFEGGENDVSKGTCTETQT